MKKTFTKIFTHETLTYLELRYSNSNNHFKKHFHDTFSLGVNVEGKSVYTNKNKEYILDENMLSIINPNVVHSCNSCTNVLNKFYMMYLDVSWCVKIQSLLDLNIKEFVPIPNDLLNDKIFYKRYIELCEFLFSNACINEKENELINFMIDFFSLYIKNSKKEKKDENFEKILLYIQEHYSLELLSEKFNLNTFYIIRLFKNNMSLTPITYLLNIRINKAKKMLKAGMSIIDTAQECGFFDQSHFHRNFIKITSTTPKEYQVNFVQ